MADSALVPVALDISLDGITCVAQRTVAVDAMVARPAAVRPRHCRKVIKRLVNGNESVAWMDEASIWHASRAKVPIWAVEALVSHTINVLSNIRLNLGYLDSQSRTLSHPSHTAL